MKPDFKNIGLRYFYENYCLIDGKKPSLLRDHEKHYVWEYTPQVTEDAEFEIIEPKQLSQPKQ